MHCAHQCDMMFITRGESFSVSESNVLPFIVVKVISFKTSFSPAIPDTDRNRTLEQMRATVCLMKSCLKHKNIRINITLILFLSSK